VRQKYRNLESRSKDLLSQKPVRDFESVEHLAEHLKQVAGNSSALAEFFHWKKDFRVGDSHKKTLFCELCKALHEDTSTKVYEGGML
jgi:hypothetical protein